MSATGPENRRSLAWWLAKYLEEYATGTEWTRRWKRYDLQTFLTFYTGFKGHDPVGEWTSAVTERFVQWMIEAKVRGGEPRARKPGGQRRWSNRSINRKLDHLRTFARWLRSQVPCPLESDPMEQIRRLSVPVLEPERFKPAELKALTRAAQSLGDTEMRRDSRRFRAGEAPVRVTARPRRDYAIYCLLKGSGLRVGAICALDIDQLRGRRLVKVKEKGDQSRTVIISEAAEKAIRAYVQSERRADAARWRGCRALFLSVPQARGRSSGRMTSRAVFNVIRKIAVRAFGPEGARKIHPHLFRHHVGHVLHEHGGVAAVQKQLGHRNTAYSAAYAEAAEAKLEEYLDAEL